MKLPFSQSVLVADDEIDVVTLVAQTLTSAGFQVVKASDGQEALDKARRIKPALVVLDLMMPKLTGTEVLRALKSESRTAEIPVIMLTARKEEVDRIVSLELGADDYVTKPFSPRELALRVRSILSRRTISVPNARVATNGNIVVDRDAHEVRVGGNQVPVTTVEYKLLNALMEQPGRVYSREELLNAVWGVDFKIELRSVDTHLRRLRAKLSRYADEIQTVRGFGYRLCDSKPGE